MLEELRVSRDAAAGELRSVYNAACDRLDVLHDRLCRGSKGDERDAAAADGLLDEEKKFYERFWCLLRDRQLMQVFEQFGPEAFRRSSVLEGFEEFVKWSGFSGNTVVEIGTLKGLTAIVLSRYFRRVVTIDVVDDPQKREIAHALGIKNIGFVTVRNNAEKAAVIEAVQFDAAFVDGDHARDTVSDTALVKRCGRVLFHEHWPAQSAVMKAVDDLRPEGHLTTQGKWALWMRS